MFHFMFGGIRIFLKFPVSIYTLNFVYKWNIQKIIYFILFLLIKKITCKFGVFDKICFSKDLFKEKIKQMLFRKILMNLERR